MTLEDLPLVSVVMPSYNQAQFLEQSILSVQAQDYPRIEHIVVDGASTDGTLAILERHIDRLTWISEPDHGQAHAINKGFRMSSGSIFAWLNSDDLYLPGAIRSVVDYFQAHPEAMLVYGDAWAIDDRDREYGRRLHVQPCTFDMLIRIGDFIVQPAAYWRSTLWDEIGPLDESLRYALDYEFWMRAAQRYELHYMPVPLARERIYAAAKSFSGEIERLEEIKQLASRYGGDGLPEGFHAEAAATYFWRGIARLGALQWRTARDDFNTALGYNKSWSKLLLYLIALTLFGPRRIPLLRLLRNRLNNNNGLFASRLQ